MGRISFASSLSTTAFILISFTLSPSRSFATASTLQTSPNLGAALQIRAHRSDARCGRDFGGSDCIGSPFGNCCSQYGWCGTSDAHCLLSNACQSGCKGVTTTLKPSTTTSKTTSRSSTTTSIPTTTTPTTTTRPTTIITTTTSTTTAKPTTTTSTTAVTTTTSTTAASTFTQQAKYNADNWFSSFTAQALAGNDPTHGFVNYLSAADGQSAGIYKTVNNQVYIGVDNQTVLRSDGPGRKSMRLSSNTAYNTGLFILDLAHAPSSQCGSWPAYWLLGVGDWPAHGEIDVLEGVNGNTKTQMTLHTLPGCNVNAGPAGQSGISGSATDCGANGGYNGCTVYSTSTNTYGNGLNSAGGGVFALHWTTSQIRVWFFAHSGSIPADITSGTPDPKNWGVPQSNFGGCNFGQYMGAMNIMFNIDFCGDWAAGVWNQGCAASTGQGDCASYVANNPSVYDQAYFLINSLKVYSG